MGSKHDTDILIVGAGPIGLCIAHALAQANFRVALMDQCDPQAFLKATYDGRTTAIAYGSTLLLNELGLWNGLLPLAEPIHEIFVTTQNHPGHIHYRSQDVGDHPLGYIVENHHLRRHLFSSVFAHQNVTLYAPTTIQTIDLNQEYSRVRLSDGNILHSWLCIAADGRKSTLRRYANISVTELPYDQTALVFCVEHTKPHDGRAFEHFLSTGPLAFLPMTGNKSSVVWSLKNELAGDFANLSAADFSHELQLRFDDTLGDLSVKGKIWSYPLSATIARAYIGKRLVLIGDAAHTIHPVAGQGFNLGLRDVKTLVDLLKETQALGLDIGSQRVLKQYQRQRRLDTHSMTGMTDSLVRLFSNESQTLSRLSSMGLSLTNNLPILKRFLTRHAMGLNTQKSLRGRELL